MIMSFRSTNKRREKNSSKRFESKEVTWVSGLNMPNGNSLYKNIKEVDLCLNEPCVKIRIEYQHGASI